MATTEIAALWRRLEAWLQAEAPSILATLQDGATPEEIAATEAALGASFPDDVRAWYLRCNGQSNFANGVFNSRAFLSLKEMQQEWSIWTILLDGGNLDHFQSEAAPEIRAGWWNKRWIPILHDGGGNYDCIDLDPNTQGTVGQLIEFYYDDPKRKVIAPSFTLWLADLVERFERGEYIEVTFEDGFRRILRTEVAKRLKTT